MQADLRFGPEWAVLELLCIGLDDEDRRRRFEEIVQSGDLNWGELLEQAIRHKMETMLAFHLLPEHLFKSIPIHFARHLASVYDVNVYRRTPWYETVHRVVMAFEAKGIAIAGRKQVTFEGSLYQGNGSRRLGDIDLLILPQDMQAASEALTELGFAPAYYNYSQEKLLPIPRREMMIYKLSPDHLPIMVIMGDRITRFLDIDCASSMTWSKSPYDIPLEEAMATVERREVPGLPGIRVPVLAPEFEMIGTVMHLFREAWFERWLDIDQDVDLAKFGDVIRLWRSFDGNFEALKQAIDRYDLRKPLLWVFEHMDRTFGTRCVDELGWQGQVDEDWLASAHSPSGEPRRWRGTMRERLQTKDRRAVFAELGAGDIGADHE